MTFGALIFLLWDLFQQGKRPLPRIWLAGVICVISWLLSTPFLDLNTSHGNSMLIGDPFALCMNTIILGGLLLTIFLNDAMLTPQRVNPSIDVDVLLMLAAIGGMVMVATENLIVLFIGFELLSVSVYVLSGIARAERASVEGALKYFILGAFSSAFLLYGIALVYGATGSVELDTIRSTAQVSDPLLLLGLGLIVFGFAFKVSLVPFHFWAPDVYQGAPTSITAFMAVVVKAAAFGAFFRVMISGFGMLHGEWQGVLWLLAVFTMTTGNIVALRQSSIKRMLAYSSISHAGYALMGFISLGEAGGGEAMIFYLLVYSLMTIGAFGVVLVATAGSDAQYDRDTFQSLSGLGWTHPFLGIVMTISILSLAGFPPLAGFMGKFYLFRAALSAGFPGLALIAAINSVISLYYYLRVIVVMYFSADESASETSSTSRPLFIGPRIALFACTVLTIYFGLFSWRYFAAAYYAVNSLS